jgi:spore coat protein U-like protein
MLVSTRCRILAVTALGLFVAPLQAQATTVSATFQVTLTVLKVCSVTAGAGSNIALGTQSATATNVLGSNTISVTCTKTTPYFIGLSPSNNSTTGAGILSGATGGNTDTIAYKLSSTAGPSGTVWGNTATSTAVGNGVAGTGSGSAQSLTVYVTVPAMNYTPDNYSDTVTVNVNY